MTWTTQKPTQPGWYWYRHTPLSRSIVRNVEDHNGRLMYLDDRGYWWEILEEGAWQGPLVPEENNGLIAAALRAQRRDGLEEAAKIADRQQHIQFHPDLDQEYIDGYLGAAYDIAKVIRQQAQEER